MLESSIGRNLGRVPGPPRMPGVRPGESNVKNIYGSIFSETVPIIKRNPQVTHHTILYAQRIEARQTNTTNDDTHGVVQSHWRPSNAEIRAVTPNPAKEVIYSLIRAHDCTMKLIHQQRDPGSKSIRMPPPDI